MTDVTTQSTPVFPLPRTCPFAPPAEYDRLRATEPVARVPLPNGDWAWAVSRHEDVRSVLTDSRFSSDRTNPLFPRLVKGERVSTDAAPSLINMDPPEHGPARRAVVGEFTVKRMQAMRPRIQQIVDGCLDDLLAAPRPADLVRHVSLPVPSLVICELLGVSYADHDFFQSRTSLMIARATPHEERMQAFGELNDFLGTLVTAKEAAPGDDLLGRQILRQRETGEVDHAGLVSLAFLLLVAGHETTANMISLGTVLLLENPGQLDRLRRDPERTLPAVEELLRYCTIADLATSRVAVADVEVGGVLIRAGEGVLALGNAANRDPEVFAEPHEFDIDRGARHHVAFGYGIHQCLGQNLARLELQVVFDTLFRRFPGLRLAVPMAELPFKDDAFVYGLHEVPVTW
ncbi:cytochrome P450 [Pilimelia terevasa]|uniref:Cytochrome P450 n=1 Tax=Pilimelia terevasa TaxID=53372 RepID=A0A8J3BHT7_9ACTN|nr:cytochrome P450 [Pilimelia terevasa]GGK22247.1 cytochrome P450 [Pilimelia terevasa]